MSDAKGAGHDPSMDDILASIRKIISDDEARAQVGGVQAAPGATAAPPASRPGTLPPRDDVLLLTDLIEEPKTVTTAAPTPTPMPMQRVDPVRAAEIPQPSRAGADPSAADQPLVGASVAGATASAFERLSQAVKDSVPPPVAVEPGPSVGSGGKTIEELVREMLRPMLKEWLDRNLPPMVERFVEREIVRLTRR
jgi:cell pole-organizing protein PopZ